MFKMFKSVVSRVCRDERGSYMVEVALVLIVIVLALVANARELTTEGITPKYEGITNELESVEVPDLG